MTDVPPPTSVSRRRVLGGSAALGVGTLGVGLAGLTTAPAAADSSGPGARGATLRRSRRQAVSFLQGVTDAYRTSGPRLAQSYQDESGLEETAFVYDNALASMALLFSGDVARARAIGDGLLFAQENDANFDDFRLRQAYQANNFVDPAGNAIPAFRFGFLGTAVGDMAWSGIALAQLAFRTGDRRYLRGAVRIGQWIQTNTFSTTGLGGYTFGETAGLEGFKSSEHNIDLVAFFRMLARLTGNRVWSGRSAHAAAFVRRMWNAEDGFFWTGSNDGATINKNPRQLPLDVQTWAWLAFRLDRYAAALDWAATNLASTDTPQRTNSSLTGNVKISGVVFASGSLQADTDVPINGQLPNTGAVWFEGTSQLALSLDDRGARGDRRAATELFEELQKAQDLLGRGQTFGGQRVDGGLVAASSPMDTGFGFGYFPNLHVGATAWYVFAAAGDNPYRLRR